MADGFYKLVLDFNSPIINKPNLDSVLSAQHCELFGVGSEGMFGELRDLGLTIFDIQGHKLYKCSTGFILDRKLYRTQITSSYRQKDIYKTDRDRSKSISDTSGAFKSVALPVIGEICRLYYFVSITDYALFEELIKNVKYVGKYQRIGFGEIKSYFLEKMDKDLSCEYKYKGLTYPTRVLPDVGQKFNGAYLRHCGYRPPYWAQKYKVFCWQPC